MADNGIFDNTASGTQRIINATTGIQIFSNSVTDNSFSLGPGDTDDYYKLTVSRSSNVIIKLNSDGGNANVSLLTSAGDPNTTVVPSSNNPNSLADAIVTDPAAPLQAGQTYYIRVFANNPATTINYTLSVETIPTTRADLLWRNYGSLAQGGGLTGIWYMDGTQVIRTELLNPSYVDTSWFAYGIGNFDGTGNPNYIWRSESTGTNGIWLMDSTGTSLQGSVLLPGFFGNGWFPGGIADFNNDGQQDILWTNALDGTQVGLWFMNGTSAVSFQAIDSMEDPNWLIEAVADFSGDGKPDLWYRNFATGENLIWLMNGTQYQGQIGMPSLDANFDARGAGDFNGDGKPDVIFRNRTTGQVDVWFMNGTSFLSSTTITTIDPIWDISGIVTTSQKVDLAGDSASTAFYIGKLDATANYSNILGPSNTNDYYSFTLDAQSKVSVTTTGTGLAARTQIQIETADGTVLGTSTANGADEQKITDQTLDPGTYFVRIISSGSSSIKYNISIGAAPQLPVNLFLPTTPAPLQLQTLTGSPITPSTPVSVLNPYTLNVNYNVEYTGRPLSSFKLAFFLSQNPAGTPNDYRFDLNNDGQRNSNDFITITNQPPGTVISRTTQLTLPSKDDPFWVQDGVYYIRIVLDPENEIPEADLQGVPREDDNQASVAIRVRDARLPDLRPDNFTAPTAGTKGGQLTVSGNISNIGTAASDTQNPPGTTFEVRFYLSKDNQLSGADFFLGSSTLNPIAAGAQTPFSRSVTLPTSWGGYTQAPLDNNYYLIAIVDEDLELNELTGGIANNVTSRLISIV
ncbi:FG-GAP-like repeat-containing protein [Leptodesmis sichuanensis]|uniref:FG-GAP-like repeat-containing protein n=1 Tax=Leptodesmis sichuanensis TaxID=2906798 RepID=UPI001F478284|nr:FG-GAP-like repeat-containing protein [Leptodesmis sichuanensis]UIE38299.1 VCBS repeat-containing protein [Leptodesmis sichuanensis A121]